ncbi:MAG: hypothetical protein AABX04_01025 [Nanoarchaeota archaeon]
MKKKKRSLVNKIGPYTGIVLTALTLILVIGAMIHFYLNGTFSIEDAAKEWIKSPERYFRSQIISENRGVAFIEYNCVTKRDCRGQYLIFIDKVGDKWIVNESSKKVLW